MYIQPNVIPVKCFKNNPHENLQSEMDKIKKLILKDEHCKWLQTDV